MNLKTRKVTVVAGLVLTGLFAGGAALAGAGRMDRGRGGHGEGMTALLSKLNLSDDQKAQVKTVMDDEHGKIAPLADQSLKAHRALNEAIHAPALDENAVRAAAAATSGVEGDLAVERARSYARIRAILTPDQQKQLDTLREQFLDRMQQRASAAHARWSPEAGENEDAQ